MPLPFTKITDTEAQDRRDRVKIRNRIISIITLLLTIIVLFSFLVNYKGFKDWQQIDANLIIFVAVNVNIVLLTTVFYMILRNLFKLIYERKRPFTGFNLKTKLIIAFVALSLPSTAFHLLASGFMAFIFENWSQGEYRQLLENAQLVTGEISARREEQLRKLGEKIMPYLPKTREGYVAQTNGNGGWLSGYTPRHQGGLFIYDEGDRVIARWVSSEEIEKIWKQPPPQNMANPKGAYWVERETDQALERLLIPLPNENKGMRLEVFQMVSPELSTALIGLGRNQSSSRVLTRELAPLMLTFLVVMTLSIILAATWIAFYLARGFTAPIEQLSDATQRVSEGELGYQVDQKALGPLEADFKDVVSSFNAMSRQLAEQRKLLMTATDDLRSSHHTLGERNRLVELLLENIDAGIVSLDPRGNITALNRTAKRLVPTKLDVWEGRHFGLVLPKDMVGLLESLLEKLPEESQRQITQNLNLGDNRRSSIIEVTLLGLESHEGQSEGVVVMLKDVTAMQRNQRALAWREVARRVAHEIKNPLTPIQLSAQRIRRKYLDGGDTDTQVLDQSTETIINAVTSLKKMVNEFSQFASLPEAKPVPDNINQVIEEVAQLYQSGLPDSVALELDLDKKLPEFPLDREQIKRVFTNLIDNAVAALNGGGKVSVQTKYDKKAHVINVEVVDDGAGVPESVRSRMFEPYTSTKEGGTGLGLTIVNQIVSDHNGYIRYNDRKPKGSVFSMEFRV